jgi:hypothetical protein
MRADSWDADRISVVQEYQCRPHSSDYSLRGLAPLRVWADYDPATQRIVAFHTHIGAYENKRTIYLDGRLGLRSTRHTRSRDSRPACGTATC